MFFVEKQDTIKAIEPLLKQYNKIIKYAQVAPKVEVF